MLRKNLTVFCTVVCCALFVDCRPNNGDINSNGISVEKDGQPVDKGPGTPLFLTPYIEQGQLKQGRKKATVKPFVGNIQSYAGYLTVNKKYNSNIFFWYFKSFNDPINDPTVVWLQGGPGSSSLFGLFNENGPYIIGKKQKLIRRKETWSKICNIVYFDNPVGTGYSFTDSESGYATNQTKVGKDLYEALVQLLTLFPDLQKNNLFLTGESYAGKYIPAFAHTIHWRNQQKPKVHVNLKGLFIGNGFTDPVHMMVYSNYLHQLGLIDDNSRKTLHKVELRTVKLINRHKWKKATQLLEQIVGDKSSLYYKYTGLTSYYNYIDLHSGDWEDYEQAFVLSDLFRKQVHVGNTTYSDGVTVYKKLFNDQPKSVINWVVELLKHYRVLFFNGQLDIICAYPLTVNYLQNMKWNLSHEYKAAKRHIYRVNGDVAGYYKSAGNLTEILVRNAGHMVSTDQPVWSIHLLNDFMHNNITNTTDEVLESSSLEFMFNR